MRAILFLLILLPNIVLAQGYNPLLPPNTYQSKDNPNYWKNKMPFEGYWQQDVHYQIKADINERTDIITATEKLTYTNNSKDELSFVYFHLYQEAFQPGSYADELQRVNKENPRYGKYEQKGLSARPVPNIFNNGANSANDSDDFPYNSINISFNDKINAQSSDKHRISLYGEVDFDHSYVFSKSLFYIGKLVSKFSKL
jgi:hypothetical protein